MNESMSSSKIVLHVHLTDLYKPTVWEAGLLPRPPRPGASWHVNRNKNGPWQNIKRSSTMSEDDYSSGSDDGSYSGPSVDELNRLDGEDSAGPMLWASVSNPQFIQRGKRSRE